MNPFHGPNLGYVLDLYDRYRKDPSSVDERTAAFFAQWSPEQAIAEAVQNGGAAAPLAPAAMTATTHAAPSVDLSKVTGAFAYARAIRLFGHLAAQIDPLGGETPGDPELDPAYHGLTDDDLRALPPGLVVDGPLAETSRDAYEAVQRLRSVYMGSIGYDNEHIHDPEERRWLRDVAENRTFAYQPSSEHDVALLKRLIEVEAMEQFLQTTFSTKYRFSIEGLDMLVPMLDEIVNAAKRTQTRMLAIGMAHRGRLNVLAHTTARGYRQIFAEFADEQARAEGLSAVGETIDDVKYHKGATYKVPGSDLTIRMSPNPSHLEAVNPVVIGMARAAGTERHQRGAPRFDATRTQQVLIHGDGAFPGQGIVAETFNLSRLPGYRVGGTVHIIANNQLAFTTEPIDGRSTLYASDLAKGYRVPIVHVNADDPAACIEVARMAAAYIEKFEKDFLIDLIGYRKYGHNEMDEPRYTQPVLYQKIREHDPVRKLWATQIVERGSVAADEAEAMYNDQMDYLRAEYDAMTETQAGIADPHPEAPEPGAARVIDTAVPSGDLIAINDALRGAIEADGFTFLSKRFQRALLGRRTALNDPQAKAIDWAGAEELAFATILADGIPIRMSGQEVQRGTFSQRHAVLHHSETGHELTPLHEIFQAKASLEIINSPLSEEAVVGFEYGYNIEAGDTLVIWEAQYGDFVNGAQNIIDEFVISAREKWGDQPSLVLLLPHGHEGAGPDHSSGRLERFLSMAAKTNCRIANPTTAAQYFHLLRRQALLLKTDPLPLIVMTPKSLLRAEHVMSAMNDLTPGNRWQPVLDDPEADPEKVTRLVFCSGKFYYDLAQWEHRAAYEEVALVRVEQLYPFPVKELRPVVERYSNVKQIIWAQEEPKNMGAWDYMGYRLKKLVGIDIPVNYVGRRRSSSPAEGSKTAWKVNQSIITEYAFDFDMETRQPLPRHTPTPMES